MGQSPIAQLILDLSTKGLKRIANSLADENT